MKRVIGERNLQLVTGANKGVIIAIRNLTPPLIMTRVSIALMALNVNNVLNIFRSVSEVAICKECYRRAVT